MDSVHGWPAQAGARPSRHVAVGAASALRCLCPRSSALSAASATSRYRFPREARLRKRRDFLKVQHRGRRLWGRQFIVYIRPGRTGRSRLGITVSRKVGGAVHRNRIKRWVREAYRTRPDLFKQPIDIVVIAKRGIEDFSLHTIRDDLARVVSRFHEEVASGETRRPRGPRRAGRPRRAGPSSGVADDSDSSDL